MENQYKYKYFKYKKKYLNLTRGGNSEKIESSESSVHVSPVSIEAIRRVFPETPFENKLLLTNTGIYSVTGKDGARFISDKIIQHMGTTKLTVTDCTANNGSDSIMFGFIFNKVNSIEIDPVNYKILKNNVNVFNLNKKINVIHGDTTVILEKLKQDVIYIDAPWGGSDYKKLKCVSLFLGKMELGDIYTKFSGNAQLFVFKVPKNYDINNLLSVTKKEMHIYPYIYPEGNLRYYVIVIKNY